MSLAWGERPRVSTAFAGSTLGGPFPHGDDQFAVTFKMDPTHTQTGERTAMQEVAICTVADGKIVREEVFGAE